MKKLISFLLAGSMAMALAACGGGNNSGSGTSNSGSASAPPPSGDASQQESSGETVEWPASMQRFSMGTGGTTGAFYIVGAGLCNVVNSYATNIDLTAEVTGATMDNLAMVSSGDCEFGLSNADFALYAYEGTDVYTEPQNILGVCSLYPTTCHIVASKSSGITSLEDMKGKRISVGPYGSGNRMGSERLLEMVGLGFDAITPMDLTNAEAIDSLKDGTIDAFILYSGAPLSSIIDLTTTTDVTWISLEKEFIDAFIMKYPYFMELELEPDVYDTDEAISCVGINNVLIVNPAVEEDYVYLVTKTIYEHLEDVWKVHTQASSITLESATNVPIPLHPGTIKYFTEIGLM